MRYSVGVTQVDRPAAAPQEGPFNLEVIAAGSPGFVAGLTAAINLFGKFCSFIRSILTTSSNHKHSWIWIYANLYASDR